MASHALAHALKDFGEPAAEEPFALDALHEQPFMMPPPEHPAVDVEAAVADAVREAEEALAARLEAEHAEQLAAIRQQHQEELSGLSAEMVERVSGAIIAHLGSIEARLVELTTSVAARILGVALTDEIAAQATEKLAATIGQALRDDETVRIRITGPSSLFEAVQAALPAHAAQLDFEEGLGVDLVVSINESLYETRISEWSAAISEVLK